MFPFKQQIAEYQYPELEFPWGILAQSMDKESNLLLERRLSLLKFYHFSKEEIINKPLYEDNTKISDFYYLNERPVDNYDYSSKYTWTLDNSVDENNEYIDPEWLFNEYRAWEMLLINYIHIGIYLPIKVGELTWGLPNNIKVTNKNNITNPLSNITLRFNIQTSTLPITERNYIRLNRNNFTTIGNNTIHIIPIGDKVYSIQILKKLGAVGLFWTDENGTQDIPFTALIEKKKTDYIKLILPITSNLLPVNNSPRVGGSETYLTPGYIHLLFHSYKIYQTEDLRILKINEPVYEVYDKEVDVDITDPWPNIPRINYTLQDYLF